MPLILASNSASGGYNVANSLRFNSGSSDNLSKVFASAETSNKIGTLSFWFKALAANQKYLVATSTATQFYLYFEPSSGILWQNGATTTRITSQVFRDPSAWYHLVVSFDTTQGTASNRQKMYLNGSEITAFSTSNDLSLNQVISFFDNDGSAKHIGSYTGGGYYDGYISEFYGIDGQALTPSSFGQTDPSVPSSGIWIPKAYTGSFGNNGFYLQFKNSAALGTDSSGNGNTFTVNNLTSVDQSTDTPTNNFSTINSILPYNTTMVLTEGNLKGQTPTDHQGKTGSFFSNFAMTKGKWYAEFKVDVEDTTMIGVSNNLNINQQGSTASAFNFIYQPYGYGYFSTGVVYYNSSGTFVSFGNSYTNGDIIGVALDLDNNKLYFSKNGTFQNGGVPTSGATGTGSTEAAGATALPAYDGSNPYFFAFCDFGSTNNTTVSANFGSPSFTIASGNADGAGFGNFEYAVPAGYYSLCTKNLADYG